MPGHIALSATVLREVCKRANIVEQQRTFRALFSVDRFEVKGWQFADRLSTDGYSVSVLLKKPKPRHSASSDSSNDSGSDSERSESDSSNGGQSASIVVGVDPGARSLVTAVSDEPYRRRMDKPRKREQQQVAHGPKWHEKKARKRAKRERQRRRRVERNAQRPLTRRLSRQRELEARRVAAATPAPPRHPRTTQVSSRELRHRSSATQARI